MANEFKIKNGLIVDAGSTTITGSAFVTGSLTVTGSSTVTGSLTITGSLLVSGSITGFVLPRVITLTSSATPTINSDIYDSVSITALSTAITAVTMSGTPVNFQKILFRIKDDGTARAITWGSSFQAMGSALPTTTVISKVLTTGFIYDTVTTKWGCVASAQET